MSSPVDGGGTGNVRGRLRASLTQNPLARPSTLIHMLASRVQDYLYFPTPDPLYIVLGTVAANMMKGSPVWIVLIGPPSSGRTIILETLAHIPKIHIVGAIKSPGALLSGVAQKDKSKKATGGLLMQIGTSGLMVMKDFTSMLSMPKEPLGEAIGALREIFDGRYSRPLGTEGGRVLEWQGRIGFLAACTPAIDQHSKLIGDMGERWVYYRYPETDGYGETMKALSITNPGEMMEELRGLVGTFVEGLGLTWEQGGADRRELESWESERFYAMSSLVCAARSNSIRDMYQGGEITDVGSKEMQPRVAGELGQLYLGLEKIGLGDDERWKLIGKVAMDSIRQSKGRVIQMLRRAGPSTVAQLRGFVGVGIRQMGYVVEDLERFEVVERTTKKSRKGFGETQGEFGASGVKLTEWARRQIKIGWEGE